MPSNSIDQIFWDAGQIPSGDARDAYLERVCEGNAALRHRVEHLLQARAQAENFLDLPAAGLLAASEEAIRERPGTVIGAYKLLEQIGEGGFGVVFMAEQTQPVRRKVALKILKPGMDTRQVVARFEAERQALALMDHPNIAHILDGGETASGRPYFVMELVRGIPITEFCDQSHLSVHQRLESSLLYLCKLARRSPAGCAKPQCNPTADHLIVIGWHPLSHRRGVANFYTPGPWFKNTRSRVTRPVTVCAPRRTWQQFVNPPWRALN
jgi:hypothetical protein